MGKSIWCALAIVAVVVAIVGICGSGASEDDDCLYVTLIGPAEFGGVELDLTEEDLRGIGCEFGDRVLIEINGKKIDAIFVTSYSGVGILDAYVSTQTVPTEETLTLGMFNADVWGITGCKAGDVAKVVKNGTDPNISKLQKYLAGTIEDMTGIPEEQFANFRAVGSPNMKGDLLYRSVSPFREGTLRSEVAVQLYEANGIEYILSIGDEPSKVEACRQMYGDSYYLVQLYDSGNVFIESINPSLNIHPDDLRRIMMTIAESDGRIVINCQLGKDRTGMVIAMLQALTGSTYDQIKAEYLQSFVNLYGIDVGSEEYETLGRMMFDRLFYVFAYPELSDMAGSVDWSVLDGYQFDMEQITLNFLKNYANMTDAEIDRLIDRLSQ